MGFNTYKLKEITEIYNAKRIPLSTKQRSTQKTKKFPYYGAQGIIDYVEDYIFDGQYLLVAEDGENLRSRNENIALISTGKFWVNNHAHILKNNNKSNIHVLKYVLNTIDISGYLTGSAQPKLNKQNLESIQLRLPDIKIQNKIGDFIEMVEDKVHNNLNILTNLEQLSQTFFKHWFIDFEFPNEEEKPYKSSGGEMVESELGEIPKGWTVNTLGNIVNVIDNRGKTPPLVKDNFSFPIIDVKALAGNSRVIDYTNCRKFVSAETYKTWFRKGHPESMDTLLSTVGSIGELKLFYYEKGCVAQNVVALRSKDISKLYIYEFMRNIKSDLVTYNIGSVQPSIKVTHIMKKQMLIPPSSILKKYDDLALPITQQIFSLDKEIQILTNLRDTLLPKLLSGEIEIPDDLEV